MIKRLVIIKLILLWIIIAIACSSCQSSRAANYKAAKEKSIQDFHKGSQGKCNRYKH